MDLAKAVKIEEAVRIQERHDLKHHGGWYNAYRHTVGVRDGWLVYDVYCLECDEQEQANDQKEGTKCTDH